MNQCRYVVLPRNIIGVKLDTLNMIFNVLSDMTVIACRRKPETSLSCADISVSVLYRWTEQSADFILKKCPLGEGNKA